jgi:hypothetical protein
VSVKEAVETLEGRPDLPSEEEGLKSSQSDRSSAAAAELGVLDGEKGTTWGLRVEEGLGREPVARSPEGWVGEGSFISQHQ